MGDQPPPKPPSWTKADDAKLFRLFRRGPHNNGCDPDNLHYKYIQNTVLRLFFPERRGDFKNFGPLYRKKAALFIADRDRREARAAARGGGNDDDDEEEAADSDYTLGSQDTDDEELEEDLEEDFVEEEDDDEMPSTRTSKKASASKKSPARPKAKAKATKESTKKAKPPPPEPQPQPPTMDDISQQMDALGLANSTYDLNVKLPYLMYPHTEDRRDKVTVEIYGLNLPVEYYHPKVNPDDAMELLVGVEIPDIICKENRQDRTHRGDAQFNANTSKNTAYKKVANQMEEDYDTGDSKGPVYIGGDPQAISLPFPCKDDILTDMKYNRFRHATFQEVFATRTGHHHQFHPILKIELTAIKKPKARTQANTSVVDDSESDDNGGGGDDGGGDGGNGGGGGGDDDDEEMGDGGGGDDDL